MPQSITIATRQSELALWQAHSIKTALEQYHSDLTINLLPLTTSGDKHLDVSLTKIGGKGLFVKELEHALLDRRADIAVHSSKDMPAEFPDGLQLGAVCERFDPGDAFVSNTYDSFETLPEGAVIGTSSLRRQCQLAQLRPDLQFKPIRGNLQTRLHKLNTEKLDAIILASAGLLRLGLGNHIKHVFTIDDCLPAVGQGILSVECRTDDHAIMALLKPLHHQSSYSCLTAERAFNATLGGNCHVPIAGFAMIDENQPCLTIEGRVGSLKPQRLLKAVKSGHIEEAHSLGVELAEQLISLGAKDLIQSC